MEAYLKALKIAVKPGSVVLDLGVGTGICTFLACQLGARKVYAIEPSEAILVAQAIAQDNHYDDRIEFIEAISTEVTLPEPVDVMISDLRGVLPLFEQHIASIRDARERFFTRDGIVIPQSDRLWATIIEAPEQYQHYASPWNNHAYGINMQAGLKFVTSTWKKTRVNPEQFLAEPQPWATLDYRSIENPNVSTTIDFRAMH
jgi:protein arginine N-methyltransferase 1